MSAHTVLLVDDHPLFRARARALLESAGYEVVGEAADADGAIAEAKRVGPDAILLDIQLPDRDGFAVSAELGAHGPAIVLISSRQAVDYGSRLPDCNTRGFIHKPDLCRATLAALLG